MVSALTKGIETGKRVKLSSVISSLEKEGVSRSFALSSLESKHVGNGYYIILSISPELEGIISRLDVDRTSRCSLATQNKSHNTSVGYSFLLIKKESGHPSVVTFDSNGFSVKDFELSKHLVIIENLKNFSMCLESMDFLRTHCQLEHDGDIDIVYGSGKNATSKLMKTFYDRYSHIYLFLDMDLGGLEIAKSIMDLTTTPCEFMMPAHIETYLQNVVAQTSEQKIEKIYALASRRAELVKAANAMIKHRKEFEQEGYLNDY